MRLIVTNPALNEALKAQGKDWTTFTRQEMRTVVCANCHVEYYFKGAGKYLTFPWAQGTDIDSILAYYEASGFKDWDYPDTGTPMLKAQHPEYETFTANSTHYQAGVACADCHMPYVRDGASKFSSHDVHSPLLNPEQACGQCHTDTEYVGGPRQRHPGSGGNHQASHRGCHPRCHQRHQGRGRGSPDGRCGAARPSPRAASQGAVHVGLCLCREQHRASTTPNMRCASWRNPPTTRGRRRCWRRNPSAIRVCCKPAPIIPRPRPSRNTTTNPSPSGRGEQRSKKRRMGVFPSFAFR